ncbi:MAG: glutamine synthetase family protein [Lentisphaeria bacterium]|nr:glutamine synthetase family protein [Candidatus Neomarinimicrobiota bacterium]MCF7841531.1 glutamine synthetase family protein [Lentisphaeria bacterium]
MSQKALFDSIEKDGIKFIDLQFTDLMGTVKAVTIPISKLPTAIEQNVWFDGSSIEGFTRITESDMYLKLDLDSYAILPWTANSDYPTARIICDVYLPDGNLYPGSPRTVLRRQLEKLEALGYTMNVGPELEFFLVQKTNGKIEALPHDDAGYFDQATDMGTVIRQEITEALQAMNIDVEALHHEVAAGQHEIDFRYNDALTVADHAMTFKFVVKTIAHRHGLHATFMPKPIAGINGSGMHVHQSLFKDGKNVFFSPDSSHHLSDLALYWIGGLIKHARALTAILNPTVNSYKRLVKGYEAPVYVCWATRNRSALIRVPRFTPGREASSRMELRSPDPSANPYLAFAVMAAAGLDGIQSKIAPPEPAEEQNIFEISDEDLNQQNVPVLPASLREAITELSGDEVLTAALGEELFQKFSRAKMQEWMSYSTAVSQWELDTYLEII